MMTVPAFTGLIKVHFIDNINATPARTVLRSPSTIRALLLLTNSILDTFSFILFLICHTLFISFRRYGALDNGRFCFEGGSRCGKGEGLHVLRMDDPAELKAVFDLAAKNRLENKRKSMFKTNCEFSPRLLSS